MIFRGKRGVELTLYDAMEVVMAVAIILTFYNHAVTAGRNTDWEKRYLAGDIALTLDTATAVPGNLLYTYVPRSILEQWSDSENLYNAISTGAMAYRIHPYAVPFGLLIGYYWGTSWQPLGMIPLEISQYRFEITEGEVTVGGVNLVGGQLVRGSSATQGFVSSQLHIAASLLNPPLLTISKMDQTIDITADPSKLRIAQCPVVDTEGILDQKTVFLDPGVDQATKDIANMIGALCPNCRVLSQGSVQDKLGQLQQADLIISFSLGDTSNANDIIARIPVDAPASSKLGCLLSNRITFIPPFGNARTLPVDLASLADDDPQRILQQNVPSVMLLMGSQDMVPVIDQAKKGEIARAIYDGLRLYYGAVVASPQQSIEPVMTPYSRPEYTKQNGIAVVLPKYGQIVLNPSTVCDASICEQNFIAGKGIGENTMEKVIIHATEGGDYQGTREHFERLLNDPDPDKRQIATQWILNRDGRLLYVVPEQITVIHIAEDNRRSIGIEISNALSKCEQICQGERAAEGICMQDDCSYPSQRGLPSQEVAMYGVGYVQKKYERYNDEQMKALLKLTAEIMIRHEISRENLLRHLDISIRRGRGHTDPGPLFDWISFRRDVESMLEQYTQQTQLVASR